jgi:bifunctional DNA-binding transcriptional regulator/antitoxin component of YhaV-PrlF toxin-antitoxin module
MIAFMIMRVVRISRGGQISVPAEIRRRWNTSRVTLDDRGDSVLITPAPDDVIAAARGALAGGPSADELRARARRDELAAEKRDR